LASSETGDTGNRQGSGDDKVHERIPKKGTGDLQHSFACEKLWVVSDVGAQGAASFVAPRHGGYRCPGRLDSVLRCDMDDACCHDLVGSRNLLRYHGFEVEIKVVQVMLRCLMVGSSTGRSGKISEFSQLNLNIAENEDVKDCESDHIDKNKDCKNQRH